MNVILLLKKKMQFTQAIQVCYDLNEDNKKREIDGLIKALEKFDLSEGLILTYDQQSTGILGKTISIIYPTWRWFLRGTP